MNTLKFRHLGSRMLSWTLIPIALLCVTHSAQAQCDSAYQRFANRGTLLHDGTILPPNCEFAGYNYLMHYDSCDIKFWYTQAQINDERIIWQNWCEDSVHDNWEDSAHREMAKSYPFTIHTNDTVRFFRGAYWNSTLTSEYKANNYKALDTLMFLVELIDTNNVRVALLDSIRFDAQFTSGNPQMYAYPVNNPVVRFIQYKVPPELNNQSVMLHLAPYVKGSGPHYLTRFDRPALMPAGVLCDDSSIYRLIANDFSLAIDSSSCQSFTPAADSSLAVSLVPDVSGRKIRITYRAADSTHYTSISVFPIDSIGYNTNDSFYQVIDLDSQSGINQADFVVPSYGKYTIALQHNRNVVATLKIDVQLFGLTIL